ncbi:MAG: HU family DNA-binding protein [Bacilli bacterium]|nr:HU family DNA-binding protein [Bacilli bacterium]
MKKEDYIKRIYEKADEKITKRDIVFVVNSLFELMGEDLKNEEKITISNFGTFDVSKTKAMNIYSPYDGKLLENVVQTRIHFKASNALKEK